MVQILIGLSFIALGGVMIYVGIALSRRVLNLLRTGIRTLGQIVEIINSQDPDAYPTLVVTFADSSGVEQRGQVGSDRRKQSIGDSIALIYDPADPKNLWVTTIYHLWSLPSFMIVIGTVFFVGGVWVLVQGFRYY